MSTLSQIRDSLKYNEIDAWMLINAENKDPYFKKYVSKKTNALSVAIISRFDYAVFANSLDIDNLTDIERGEGRIIEYDSKTNVSNKVAEYLEKYNDIQKIALNFSTMNDVHVDVLGHGMYKNFTDRITQNVAHLSIDSFVSSEAVIYSLVDRKSQDDLMKMRTAANRAHQVITDAFKKIRPGMTENELVDLVHSTASEKPSSYHPNDNVVDEEYAWEEALCPIALTGDSFTKGGHAVSGETEVKEGSTVYFDFGVQLTFDDGSSFSSDIQRTGYVLRSNEASIPLEIKDRFDAVIGSITEGIENIKPGMSGFEADEVVRGYLQERGFKNYDHATGHAIGGEAHNPGTVLADRKEGRSALKVQPNGVYTIEPRIPVPNGVSVEEMVVFFEDKPAESLSPRQTEPILIDGHLSS